MDKGEAKVERGYPGPTRGTNGQTNYKCFWSDEQLQSSWRQFPHSKVSIQVE